MNCEAAVTLVQSPVPFRQAIAACACTAAQAQCCCMPCILSGTCMRCSQCYIAYENGLRTGMHDRHHGFHAWSSLSMHACSHQLHHPYAIFGGIVYGRSAYYGALLRQPTGSSLRAACWTQRINARKADAVTAVALPRRLLPRVVSTRTLLLAERGSQWCR